MKRLPRQMGVVVVRMRWKGKEDDRLEQGHDYNVPKPEIRHIQL